MQRILIFNNKIGVHIQQPRRHQNNGMQRTQMVHHKSLSTYSAITTTHDANRTTLCDGHRSLGIKTVSTYDTIKDNDMQRTQIIKNKNCVHIRCHQNQGMQRTQTINLCPHTTHNASETTICDGPKISFTKYVSTYDTQSLQTNLHPTTIDDNVQDTMRHRTGQQQLQVTPTSDHYNDRQLQLLQLLSLRPISCKLVGIV